MYRIKFYLIINILENQKNIVKYFIIYIKILTYFKLGFILMFIIFFN